MEDECRFKRDLKKKKNCEKISWSIYLIGANVSLHKIETTRGGEFKLKPRGGQVWLVNKYEYTSSLHHT